MADLASSIPQLYFGQSDKETTVNELFDAASPALLFGRDGVSSQGLNFGLLGGRFFGAVVPNQVLALPDGETAYLSASAATGAVSVDVGDFAAGALPLYKVTTLGGLVTDYEDHRMTAQGAMGGIIDKQGKVLDDLIEIADYSASIDGLTTPGGYIVKVDFVNYLLSGATILVAENSGIVSQTIMATALSKIGTRYKDGVSWTEWVYCLAPSDVLNWYGIGTASAADAVINADGTFSRSVSSEEWKREIEPMQDSYADAIVQGAAPIYFRSKCERDPQDWSYWGISAEQLATVDPRLVHWGHSTKEVPQPFGQPPKTVPDLDSPLKPVGVQYSRIVPALLNAVKRQGLAIAALEARLTALEGGAQP